jgi:hypothetical protein
MNPKDLYDDGLDDFDIVDSYNHLDIETYRKKEAMLSRMKLDAMKRERAEQVERANRANQAYADLCDALGVKSLNASIDGDSGHIRIPVASIETAVARIESLRTNVLAEGAL